MNHPTKIGSLFVLLMSSAFALSGCLADATGTEDPDEAAASAPNTEAQGGKGANPESASEENTSQGSQELNQAFGYYPPGYGRYGRGANPWYSGYGYLRPGLGYFQPGYGYLPGGYGGIPGGYGGIPGGYGFWRPGFGYWRPNLGYFRPGYGFGYGTYGGW